MIRRKIERRLLLAIAATAMSAMTAIAATAEPLIINPAGRDAVSLDGQWHTIVDPYAA